MPPRHEKVGSSQFSVVMVGAGDEVGPFGRTIRPGRATATASAMPMTTRAEPTAINHTFTLTTLMVRALGAAGGARDRIVTHR